MLGIFFFVLDGLFRFCFFNLGFVGICYYDGADAGFS